jgi:gluconolactonase
MAVEKVAPGIERLVSLNAEIEWLASGFGGLFEDGGVKGVAEGPVWFHEKKHLLFSDNANSKRHKWTADKGVELYKEGTNDANGMTRDPQGRLLACEHATRRVTREELDGSITVVANNYRGFALNRPNDICVKSDGAIYFTDPITMRVDTELDFAGVYRVSPDLARVNLVVRDFVLPNGIALSPDESILYVNDSLRMHIRAFTFDTFNNTGLLNLASDRVFCQMGGSLPGAPDGMKADSEGNVWCTGPGGIWIIDPAGRHLGTILAGDKHITNFCFGGDDLTTLFVTGLWEFGRVEVKVRGLPTPRNKK